jgi:superfamily II DNA/RNA helicase|tara:strand:+ start:5670 stop:7079 length:1410 start_codon:yes stop_codon:yes gene_type:complete
LSAEITSFSDFFIHDRIEKALDNLRLRVPTDVQKASIPHALDGKDLQVCAETGSGKTLAYILPMMQKFLESKSVIQGTRGLILCPTRELARQVFKATKQFTDVTGMNVGLLTGGDDFKFQAAMLRKNPEIVVSTPGRLVDHIKRRSTDLVGLEILVLDEADRMLDMGFAEDMEIISGECNEGLRQTLLFSATLHHKGIARVAAKVLDNPMEITTATVRDKHDNISQQIILADDGAHKDRLLSWLLSNDEYEKAIIFTNTRIESERLNVFLRQHSCRCAVLHGELSQDQRNATMQLYREGKINVLVATDVASRGLDVKGIDLVVNYDMARKGDDYVHRIGRTGRAGETGTAISLINHTEWNLKAAIERYIKQEFEPRAIKELKGAYSGPKRLKASGKAAGSKKKKAGPGRDKRPGKGGIKGAPAVKKVSAKKANGPRPSRPKPSNLMDSQGFAPIKKKKNPPAPKSSQDD